LANTAIGASFKRRRAASRPTSKNPTTCTPLPSDVIPTDIVVGVTVSLRKNNSHFGHTGNIERIYQPVGVTYGTMLCSLLMGPVWCIQSIVLGAKGGSDVNVFVFDGKAA